MNRREFRQLADELLFVFIFLMIQVIGVLIVFKDQL